MHPKLEPILEVASCAATELMWATRRATDDIVDMVSSRVRLENQGKVRIQSLETFPYRPSKSARFTNDCNDSW